MKNTIKVWTFLLLTLSCQSNESNEIPIAENHVKYFGFTLIDTFYDDPLDAEVKTNYIDEVASFSNIADVLVIQPTDNILDRLALMKTYDVKVLLHVYEIFFEYIGTGGPSGTLYDLRSDYKQRWDTLVETNNLTVDKSMIRALYLGEEPTWNSISYIELKAASDYIKSTIDTIPIMIIEAYPSVNQLQVPSSVDWVGFDHYFIEDPKNDATFLNELAIVKSKLVNEDQKLVLILDAHYIQEGHGNFAEISLDQMADVATSYYELALSESKVIALIGYTWPGGFDTPTALGARQLPQQVKDEYVRIGKKITGK